MIANGSPSSLLISGGLLVMALFMPLITSADCVKDLSGEVYCGAGRCVVDSKGMVWCSKYYDGDAVLTLDGHALCGKGHCAKLSTGKFFCSSEVGGAVLMDSRGRVRCYGQCEPASSDMCEQTRAGSSDN